MIAADPNNYSGSDIEKILRAVEEASLTHGVVRITRRKADASSDRDFWLIDSAILLPGNVTVYVCNCTIKLSDRSRDNFFRSKNCVPGEDCPILSSIHIIGEGSAVLEGADHPRSTGDGNKILGEQTYGTDAGKAGCEQKGDWRNIGILFGHVRDFSIENLKIKDSHCWAVSLEYCQNGRIRDLHFDSCGSRLIDGKKEKILNQDGVDLRRGCRNITIENISGCTGDDLIALTAIGCRTRACGSFGCTEFLSSDPEGDDTCFITIRNVKGYCAGGHNIVRFLNKNGTKLHHVSLEQVMDTSPPGITNRAALKIGDQNYGTNQAKVEDTSHIIVHNILSRARSAVNLCGALSNSSLDSIFNCNPDGECISENVDGSLLQKVHFSQIHELV